MQNESTADTEREKGDVIGSLRIPFARREGI